MYLKMIQPLKGDSIYSFRTLKLKLEMDLMIREYFNENDLSNDDDI